MRTFTSAVLGVVLALFAAGCDYPPIEAAPLGGTPPVEIPVGPVPGPDVLRAPVENPYARDPIALAQGRKLFVWFNCAGCHGGRGGGGMGPSLRDVSWMYGSSDAAIFDSIAAGRAHGMPAWGLKLPEQEIWKIAAYIDSMGTSYEPAPPDVEQPKVNLPPEDMNLRRQALRSPPPEEPAAPAAANPGGGP